MSKTWNLILMIIMAILAGREAMDISQNGANNTNMLFLVIFSIFAIRRFMIHQKLTEAESKSNSSSNTNT